MFSSYPSKNFLVVVLALLSIPACRLWDKPANFATPSPENAKEILSDIPFPTKEPEVYQAEILTTSFLNEEALSRKTFSARHGSKWLTTFNVGEKHAISLLKIDAKVFLIHYDKRVYTEKWANQTNLALTGESLGDFLTTEWLNQKADAVFENQGEENGLTKYSVRLGSQPNSETVIFVNESFRIPVKQNFYTVNGEQKTLIFSTEVTNLKLMADDGMFQIPADCRKVAAKEFQDLIWQEKLKRTE